MLSQNWPLFFLALSNWPQVGLAEYFLWISATSLFKEYCTVTLLENSAHRMRKTKLSFEQSSDELGHLTIGIRSDVGLSLAHFR